jgi:hypothetical protein
MRNTFFRAGLRMLGLLTLAGVLTGSAMAGVGIPGVLTTTVPVPLPPHAASIVAIQPAP